MDELKKFSQAILQGVQAAKAGPDIAGISPETNMAFSSRKGAPLLGGGMALAGRAGTIADQEEAERKAAQQRRIQELQDLADPGKYERRRKDDGGFAFFDPTGKEIGIDMYAKRTGVRPAEILKDSDNPLDRQFVNDYSNMNDLMQAAFNGDNDTVNSILDDNGLSRNTKPQSYMSQLVQRYPHIYGTGAYQESLSNLNKPVFRVKPKSSSNVNPALQQMIEKYAR